MSVKGPGNTFDWNTKWARNLPSLIYFSWDIYRDPPLQKQNSNIKVDIWHTAVKREISRECSDIIGSAKGSQISEKILRRSGEGEKGRYLPWSKEEEGAYIFWMKCLCCNYHCLYLSIYLFFQNTTKRKEFFSLKRTTAMF
jgi:hypothetical protein